MPQSKKATNKAYIESFPLLDFFTALQHYDKHTIKHQSLTVSEYLPVIDIMAQGIGLTTEEDLYSICKLLWFKPYHSEKMFRKLFESYRRSIREIIAKSKAEQREEKKEATKKKEKVLPQQEGDLKSKFSEELKKETKLHELEEKKSPNDTDLERKEDKETRKSKTTSIDTVYMDYSEGGESIDQTVAVDRSPDEVPVKSLETKKYILTGSYFPISTRQLQQGYQLIREELMEGPKNQILWPETIQKIARDGFFSNPVLTAVKKRKSILYFFFDYSDSMIAFHRLCEDMKASLLPYRSIENQVYYFFNHLSERLFLNPERTASVPFDEFVAGEVKHILIISDAGAARRRYSFERIDRTRKWLKHLDRHRVIWFNPMPRDYWENSSAKSISYLVPMFELNDKEFSNAVNQLK